MKIKGIVKNVFTVMLSFCVVFCAAVVPIDVNAAAVQSAPEIEIEVSGAQTADNDTVVCVNGTDCIMTIKYEHTAGSVAYFSIYYDDGTVFTDEYESESYVLSSLEPGTYIVWAGVKVSKNYTRKVYTVTVKEGLSVTVTCEGNGTVDKTEFIASYGEEIILNPTPSKGYHFDKWEVKKGNVVITDNKFTMPDKNVEIHAVFSEHVFDSDYKNDNEYHWKICGICNELSEKIFHSGTVVTDKKSSTCKDNGYTEYLCGICNCKYKVFDKLSEHSPVKDEKTVPECTKSGLSEGLHCGVCNLVLQKQEILNALGHDSGQWIQSKPSDCQTKGEKNLCCTRCNEVLKTEEIPVLGHTEKHRQEDIVGASCTTIGSFTDVTYCDVCKTVLKKESVTGSKLSHVFEEKIEDSAHLKTSATCKSYAVYYYDCINCEEISDSDKYTFTGQVFDSENHESHSIILKDSKSSTCTVAGYSGDYHYDCCDAVSEKGYALPLKSHETDFYKENPSTCTENGNIAYYKCSVCKKLFSDSKAESEIFDITDLADGHQKGEWTLVVNPKCESDGEKEVRCKKCNVLLDSAVVFATGHVEKEWRVTETATCSSKGEENLFCKNCNKSLDKRTIEKKQHTETTDIAIKPTCISTGLSAGSHCLVCNEILIAQTVIPMTKHTYRKNTVPPNCTLGGYTEYTCTYCEDKYITDEVNALGHTEEIRNKAEETCCSKGYSGDLFCDVCNVCLEKGYFIDANAQKHSGKADVAKNRILPTCTQYGYSGDIYWSCCGVLYEGGISLFPTTSNHTGSPNKTVNIKTATCTEKGYSGDIYWSCCNTLFSMGHDTDIIPSNHTGTTDKIMGTKPANCVENGYSGDICWSCCESVYQYGTDTDLIPENHKGSPDKIVNSKISTCTQSGYTGDVYYSCCGVLSESGIHTKPDSDNHTGKPDLIKNFKDSTCSSTGYTGDTYWSCCNTFVKSGSVIEQKAHTVVTQKEIPATCETEGFSEGKICSVCKTSVVLQTKTDVLGHDYVSNVIPAGCLKNGYTSYECSRCKKNYIADIKQPTEHSWTDYFVTVNPTTYEEGIKTRTCKNCEISERLPIEKLKQIEIVNNSNLKYVNAKDIAVSYDKVTVSAIRKYLNSETVFVDSKGNEVSDDSLLFTGMKIVMFDKDTVIDSITVVVLCDCDGDGKISASDARLALRYSVGLEKFTEYQKIAADVEAMSDDLRITASDARFILRTSVGLEDKKSLYENVKQ